MTFTSSFCRMQLEGYSDPEETIYHALASNPAHERVMSPAAYDAVRDMIRDWFNTPGVIEMTFDYEDATLRILVAEPGYDEAADGIADFSLPLSDLMFAAAASVKKTYGQPPSAISEVLRDLADQIDAKETDK